ncbi:MAG: 16S rRNA (guanine(527)-N(7))-methyltransferase RsmG [Clostridia bacterium]|nr:16S rRNA (guanine(527)-N(7))-methyltransferase RsmG [Clostridia bacterium]
MDKEILKKGLKEWGYEISSEVEDKFFKYSNSLIEWNKKINLTALTEPKDISIKHFLDSVSLIFNMEIPENSKVIDVGTGAGFPGIPIKIIRDDLDFVYIDSLNKRINFLKELSKSLDLKDVDFIHMRAEEAGHNNSLRAKFDFAVSRAVAPLNILAEYCIPLLKTGGTFAAFKAFEIDDELNAAKSMIGNLGGKVEDVLEIKIPCSDLVRKIVIIKKVKETPKQFPRKANKIKKNN